MALRLWLADRQRRILWPWSLIQVWIACITERERIHAVTIPLTVGGIALFIGLINDEIMFWPSKVIILLLGWAIGFLCDYEKEWHEDIGEFISPILFYLSQVVLGILIGVWF